MSASWSDLRSDPRLRRLAALHREVAGLAEAVGIRDAETSVLGDVGWAERVLRRVSSQYTIFVLGQVSSGKSSLINALLGRKLLLPSGDPTDGVISVLLPADDRGERAERVEADGRVVPFSTIESALRFLRQQDTAADEQLSCREVRLYLDEPLLQTFRFVNTPGLGDRLASFEDVTLRYLHDDESDLVVWTFFPDSSANADELAVFSRALARRRHAVLGVITHCLQGREDDPGYDPRRDGALDDVEGHVRKHLDDYLTDVVRFDSHAARKLNEELRQDPGLVQDDAFHRQMERCGLVALQERVAKLLPDGPHGVERARRASLLKRCAGTAQELAKAADDVADRAATKARLSAGELAAWRKLEAQVLAPARAQLRQDVRALAAERAGEMVRIMGDAAADAVRENFGLAETLFRSLASYTPWCDSMGDKLTRVVGSRVQSALDASRFVERFCAAADNIVQEKLESLGRQLDTDGETRAGAVAIDGVHVPADVGQMMARPLKALAASLLKHATGKIEKELASRAAQQASAQAGRAAATKAVQGAAKQAGNAAAKQAAEQAAKQSSQKLAMAGTIIGVVGLILLPLDLSKMYSDFQRGRDHAAKEVRQRYVASRAVYEIRLFDEIWPQIDERIGKALAEARRSANEHGEESRRWEEVRSRALDAATALRELAESF